jgi:oligopeptidase B
MHNERLNPPLAPELNVLRKIGDQLVPDDYAWMRNFEHRNLLVEYLKGEKDFFESESKKYLDFTNELMRENSERFFQKIVYPIEEVGGVRYRQIYEANANFEKYILEDSGSEQVVILDPQDYAQDGFVRIGDKIISPDGKYLAFTVDSRGDERYSLNIKTLFDNRNLVTLDASITYGLCWSNDSEKLIYVIADSSDRPHEVWSVDLSGVHNLIFRELDERFYVSIRKSSSTDYLIIQSSSRTTSSSVLLDLGNNLSEIQTLRKRVEGSRYLVEPVRRSNGLSFLVVESLNSGRDELVEYSDFDLNAVISRITIPDTVARITELYVIDDCIVIVGRSKSLPIILFVKADSEFILYPLDVSGCFSIGPFSVPPGSVALTFESRIAPKSFYSFDLASNQLMLISASETISSQYESMRIEVISRVGCKVPTTVIKRKDLKISGNDPVILYGYGAWENPLNPEFSHLLISMLDRGYIFVNAHVRGGGEVDRQWWVDGSMSKKINTFYDFLDVAKYVKDNFSSDGLIIAKGLSAGGLLMGSIYHLGPELFSGIIAEAPFVDPVTTMSDLAAPLVMVELDEWGDPSREEDLKWMLSWSPYDNLPTATLIPQLFVTSAINDPRVSVWEPARWVAKIRKSRINAKVLFNIDLNARGHWAPPNRKKRLIFESEMFSWVLHVIESRRG